MAKKKNIRLSDDSGRNIAVNALLAFERGGFFIQNTLDSIFKKVLPDPRERRLAAELAYGTCRELISLDYLIKKHSNRPLRRIDPTVLQIIRVGLYQLIYLSQTPDFAAIHEAVGQGNCAGLRGSGNFINAVLRSIQRDIKGPVKKDDAPPRRATLWRDAEHGCQFERDFLPDPNRNPAKYYSAAWAHPSWLVQRWLNRYEAEVVERICLANNIRASLWLRPNRLRCSADELEKLLLDNQIQIQRCGDAIQLCQPAVPEQLPGFEQGYFTVQDITAMSVAPMLKAQPGWRVLDLCASPGGKTTHLAELMGNNGTIVACDVSSEKLDPVEQNCQRLGISIVRKILAQELVQSSEMDGSFEAVLVDAPCSNTGVLARRVEVRHLLKPVAIQRLARQQQELLTTAARMLRKGGTLVYSTCSIEPVENEQQLQVFLENNPLFVLREQKTTLPHRDKGDRSGWAKPDFTEQSCDGGHTAVLVKDQAV